MLKPEIVRMKACRCFPAFPGGKKTVRAGARQRAGDNELQDNGLIDICWRKSRVYSRSLTIFARHCGNSKKQIYNHYHYGI